MGRYKERKKRGVKPGQRPPDWTDAEERKLVRLCKKGLTAPEITEKFKGSRTFYAIKNRQCVLRSRGLIL